MSAPTTYFTTKMVMKAVLLFLVCVSAGSSSNWKITLYTKEYANGTTDMGQSSPSRPTVVIVHGWLDSANNSWIILMKNEHLFIADKNIITLDWSTDAKTLNYIQSANAVPQVGSYLAQQFLQWIALNLVDPATTRFVGFSLGAQIIGFCGQKYQNLTGGQKLRYLIGLDPAAPGFVGKQTYQRLDKKDGDMVQVFHTSMGGIGARCGHVDVYFSNTETTNIQDCAVDQPGCKTGLCDHLRAVDYYIISITSSNFLAAPCTSCHQFKQNSCDISAPIVVGDQLNPTTEDGAYYLTTSSKKPFAKGTAGLQM